MKKNYIITIVLIFLNLLVTYAQEYLKDTVQLQSIQQIDEKYIFTSTEFENDYETALWLSKRLREYHKDWAQKLLECFPVDKNGVIHLEYVITCNQDFDKQKAMETSINWFNYTFSSANAVKTCDYDNGIIIAGGTYVNIASYNLNAIYYIKTVDIGADTDIIIRFKENRIKIEVIIRNYNVICVDSLMNGDNSVVNVSDTFPVNNSSNNKVAYARAFINSYTNSFDKVNKYIEFMNTNMTNPFDNSDEDW